MVRPALEVADIFRDFGPAWRQTNAGHVSLGQLKVMSAIERCRTAALGGHVARARQLLAIPKPQGKPDNAGGTDEAATSSHPCPCCGGRMRIIEAFAPGCQPHHRPSATTIAFRIDTS